MGRGWIGVDLDGTLALHDEWQGQAHIGAPIAAMVERVQRWLNDGEDVRIFTARANPVGWRPGEHASTLNAIDAWALEHIGVMLPVVYSKDFRMALLYDDRARQVVVNEGEVVGE